MPKTTDSNAIAELIHREGCAPAVKHMQKAQLTSAMLEELYENFPKDALVLQFIASFPLVPSRLLETLQEECTISEVLVAVAGNTRCPHRVLQALLACDHAAVRAAVASSKQLATREIRALIGDESATVRRALAANPLLPDTFQAILAADRSADVRTSLAMNRKLDKRVAAALSSDRSWVVRSALINYGQAGDELLQFWADGDDESYQLLLMRRRNLPDTVTNSLRLSAHPNVRNPAYKKQPPRHCELLALAESDLEEDRIAVASSPELMSAIQEVLAKDPSASVRRALANNAGIAEDLAQRLIGNDDLAASEALAANSSIGNELVTDLCYSEDANILKTLAYRDDLTADQLDILVNQRKHLGVMRHLAFQGVWYEDIDGEIADQLASNEMPLLRAFSAASLHISKSARNLLSHDTAGRVRCWLVRNRALTRKELEQLALDDDPEVSTHARKRLHTERPTAAKNEKPLLSRFTHLFR